MTRRDAIVAATGMALAPAANRAGGPAETIGRALVLFQDRDRRYPLTSLRQAVELFTV